MPFLSLNRGPRKRGVQTHANVLRLLPEIRGAEMQYLSVRDWYVNELALLAQLEEHLAQAKAAGDKPSVSEIGNRLHVVQSRLIDAKERARAAGERSYAEAFYFCAEKMLEKSAFRAIDEAAEALIGRHRHELRGKP